VPLPVFKTGVARHPGQAGSIPVRLRFHPSGTALDPKVEFVGSSVKRSILPLSARPGITMR